MPGPPSPPTQDKAEPERPCRRWDAAQRACRDNDLASLQLLVNEGGLFQNLPALQEACRSGAWGRGITSGAQKFTTQDSIRLSHLLQTATTRGHVSVIEYLLDVFPAKDLHVLEWEIIVNALASGRTEVLEPFLKVDPELVNMCDGGDKNFGTCFTVLFDLVIDKEKHLPMVKLLVEHEADIKSLPNVLEDAKRASTKEVVDYLDAEMSTSSR